MFGIEPIFGLVAIGCLDFVEISSLLCTVSDSPGCMCTNVLWSHVCVSRGAAVSAVTMDSRDSGDSFLERWEIEMNYLSFC